MTLSSAFYTSSPLSRRDRYQQLRTSLWSTRSSFDSHWREIADWILPRRTRFYAGDRNRGDRRNQNVINSTARFSARTLQSGLHAGLTSPARPWFKLTTPDPKLAEFQAVKEWLHQVTERLRVLFAASNVYNSLPTVYGDIGTFGTAAMGVLEDGEDAFRCYAYPLGSYALGLNARNLVTTFVREYQLSVRQVVEEFGVERGYRDIDWSGISATVRTLWEKGQYEESVDLCWVVTPNEEADPQRLESRYLPFASCHFEQGQDRDRHKFLRESGFRSFPILAPRWDVTGEDAYGTDCPGMTALGDVKGLQLLEREKGKAVKKAVDPPLVGAPELRSQKTSLLPGDITYVRDPDKGLRAIHEIGLNLEHLSNEIARVEYRIQRCYFEDLFLMLATMDQQIGAARPTAREVQERHEEKLLALGPVLERTNDELLDPLIDRAYQVAEDAGLIPPPPPELEGVKLKVEYISILAQAQKLVDVVGQDRFVASTLPMMETFPEVRHKINVFKLVNNYGEMLGVDPGVIRTDEEANKLAAAEAQQQRAMAEAEQAKLLAGAAKDAAAAPMGTDSALDRLAAGMGAGAPPGVM